MSINSRLSVVCKNKKIKNIDLVAWGCGSQQTVSFVLTGKQKPNSQFLEVFINNVPDLNARWLLTGSGSEIIEEPTVQYGYCKECIKKEGIIEFLKKECMMKEKIIENLKSKIKEPYPDAGSQTNKEKRAS